MTTEELKQMELHQVIKVSDDKDVMRVSTGWCYLYYETFISGLVVGSNPTHSRVKIIATTFVPEEL